MNKEIAKLLKDILEIDPLDNERMRKLRNGKYLIILDMGCGSTSAAILDLKRYIDSKEVLPEKYIYPITWDYSQNSINSVKPLRIRGNVSIPTLVGYNGLKCIVGPEALTTGNACENFKACPSDQNLNEIVLQVWNFDGSTTPKRLRDVWPNYFGGILDKICSWCSSKGIGPRNLTELMNGETIVMAAHPAGEEWSEPSVLQNYRELIAQGTGLPDENILTISEAKAAMQYIRRKPQKQNKKLDFDHGIVIIDIGASTIDVEYLTKRSANPIEYSFELAGRNVDRLLAHYILESIFPEAMKQFPKRDQVPDDDFFMERELPYGKSQFMFDIRLVKEMLSDMERDATVKSKSAKVTIGNYGAVELNTDILRGLLGDLPKDPLNGAIFGSQDITAVYELPMMEFIYRHSPKKKEKQPQGRRAIQLVNDTWYGHVENMVRFVMEELKTAGRSVAQIIVTGGSCRLLGLKEHIWNAIQASGISLYSQDKVQYMDAEQDYENSVPFGGGYYVSGVLSRMDELANFPTKLYKTLFDELQTVAAARVAEEVNKLVQEIALEKLKGWSELPEMGLSSESFNSLNKEINSKCMWTFHHTEKLNHAVERAVKSIQLKENLPKTTAEIKVLLDALAQAEFTGEINTDAIKIQLPVANVVGAVSNVKPENLSIGFIQGISGFMQELGNLLWNMLDCGYEDEGDIPRKAKYRKSIYTAYQNSKPPAVTAQLSQNISHELHKEFLRTNICGIPDQIIQDLRNDIMCALYLNE